MLPAPESLIPHRRPQLLLTRLIELDGARLIAEADFADDHWPADGIPGMQLVEGLAQAMACLGRLRGEAGAAILLGVPKAAFPTIARAPCTLRFEVAIVEQRYRITEARGTVTRSADGVVVCTASLNAALFDTPMVDAPGKPQP